MEQLRREQEELRREAVRRAIAETRAETERIWAEKLEKAVRKRESELRAAMAKVMVRNRSSSCWVCTVPRSRRCMAHAFHGCFF